MSMPSPTRTLPISAATSASLAAHDLWPGFDDGHAAAEAAIGLRHFNPGIAATEHDKMRRQFIQFERLDMGERVRVLQAGNVRHGGMRADVDDDLVAGKRARTAFIQGNFDRFRADEPAAAHDEFGASFLVGLQMQLDRTIDHVLLAASHLRHIGRNAIHVCAEAGRASCDMGHPRAPQLVFRGQTRHGRARAADPTALHDSDLLAGSTQMPGKMFAALAAAEDDDVESFRLGHDFFLSADLTVVRNVA